MQSTFTAGELAPALHSRVDLSKYHTGLKKAINCIVHAHGGVSNRPGFLYIAATKAVTGTVRLLPFRFNTSDTYMLEFGELYMRVYRNGIFQVEVVSPYPEEEVNDIRFVQSADVMFMTTKWRTPYQLSRTSHTVWAFTALSFNPSPALVTTFVATPAGFTVNDRTRSYVITQVDSDGRESSRESATTINADTIAFNDANPDTITDSGAGFGSFTSGKSVKVEGSPKNDGIYLVTTAAAGTLTLDAAEKLVAESVGATITITELTDPATATVDASWPGIAKVTLTWDKMAGADYYNVYCSLEGGTYGYIGTAEDATFIDDNIIPDISSPLEKSKYGFEDPGSEPATVGFHEQRLLFANLQNQPQAIISSQVGDFINFNYRRPRGVSDAFKFQIDSGVINEVRHVVSMNDLLVLTAGAEYRVTDNGDGFAFENISSKPQGNRGSSELTPLLVGNTLLYTLPREQAVHALSYSDQSKGYDGLDVSILSKHLLQDGKKITSWCYQQEPDSIVWAVRSDGDLLSLTYVREHEVAGWASQQTDGTFESIASVEESGEDVVYVVVTRNINGSPARHLERLGSRVISDVRDAFFVDAGITYDGASTTTITGLTHLEGEDVVALADGNVIKSLTVSGGQITLPAAAEKVHVGLPYQMEFQTLEPPDEFGKKKSVALLRVNVYRSRGMWAGPNVDQLLELKQRDAEPWGDPVELFTGQFEIILDATWSDHGGLYIQQRDPIPLTILAVIPEVGHE